MDVSENENDAYNVPHDDDGPRDDDDHEPLVDALEHYGDDGIYNIPVASLGHRHATNKEKINRLVDLNLVNFFTGLLVFQKLITSKIEMILTNLCMWFEITSWSYAIT